MKTPEEIIALVGIPFWDAFFEAIHNTPNDMPVMTLVQEALTRSATWDRDPSCDLLLALRDPEDLDSSETIEKCGPLDRRLDELGRDFYRLVRNGHWTQAYDWYLLMRQRVIDLNGRVTERN